VHPKGAYFTRGSGHDRHGAYTEDSAAYQDVIDRLARKLVGAADAVPAPEIHRQPGGEAEIAIVSLGGCNAAVLEALDRLRGQGIACDYLRVRGFPFAAAIGDFLRAHPQIFVVEQNRDAQLRALLALETGIARDRMIAVLDYGGLPLTAETVVRAVAQQTAGATV
jgi:2-oxoglutarate ferredoxin oxidoreductase subunit alpha